jgi:hypothetical protein
MGDKDDLARAQNRVAGPARAGATVHLKVAAAPKITSETVATVPSKRARIRLGVGEPVKLTYSAGSATWAADPDVGTFDSKTGETVIFTAPDRANTIKITATGTPPATVNPTITFTIVEPADVKMNRRPGTQGHHDIHTASTGFIADVYILPADVSFEKCFYQEAEVDGVGTGYFKDYYANNHVGHHPNASPSEIGPPVSDTSGSKALGFDQVDCNADKGDGGWTWSIPWSFQVGKSGAQKVFKTVDEVIKITAAGSASAHKLGGHNSNGYNDASEKDPLFD